MEKPYCACATPPGVSGIAVIRMAGEGSAEVCDRVFSLKRAAMGATSVQAMQGYTVAYGKIVDPKASSDIDEVMVTRFCAPHSYTGEESVEISCHGGMTVRQEILRVLLENGARMAQPGEFTRKAFIAGKIDLSQAEAVMDVIAADSEMALRAAESQLQGSLKVKIRENSQELYSSLAVFEMLIDEPDDEDAYSMKEDNRKKIEKAYEDLRAVMDTYRQGRILSERMNVVLCGIPNSGKSSLLNYLSGYDRAIVTDIPGTTRDTLEVNTSLSGIPVRLIDTAGIRKTSDVVESIGVERAEGALSEADIVLWLVSYEEKETRSYEDMMDVVMDLPEKTKIALLISKSDNTSEDVCQALLSDILSAISQRGISRRPDLSCVISSRSGEGIQVIEQFVTKIYNELGTEHAREVLLTNHRHFECLRSACRKIEECIALCKSNVSPEQPSLILRTALEDLGEITGDSVSDTLVDTIFSRFCVGK